MKTKGILAPTIVAVATLIMLTFGATYAYFAVSSTSNVSATASATAPTVGSVSLVTGNAVSISPTRVQMMNQGSNKAYSDTDTIATASVTGDGTYSCDYSLSVSCSGTMISKLGGTGWVVLTVDGQTLDLKSGTTKTITGTMTGLTKTTPKTISATMTLNNLTGTDQNAIAGTTASCSITVSSTSGFTCKATG